MNRIKLYEEFVSPTTKTFLDLVEENTHTIDDMVYHGTPLANLRSILRNGIRGVDHREMVATTVSTSFNSDIIPLFSDKHKTGLMYDVRGTSAFIIPEWLRAILDEESGGSNYEEFEEEELMAHCREWSLPFRESWGDAVRLPGNFLRDNLPTNYIGACYEYVAAGKYGVRDEAELIVFGKGIDYLNAHLEAVIIDEEWLDTSEEALKYLEAGYEEDELDSDENDD